MTKSARNCGFGHIYWRNPWWKTSFFAQCRVYLLDTYKSSHQKQPTRSVLRNSCSENMQQIYRSTPMPKCDFNKVSKQLYWNHILAWVFSCKFAAYFQSSFPRNTSGWLLLKHSIIYQKSHEHNPQESASSKSSDVNLQLHSKKYFFMDIEQLFLRASSSCLLIYNNPLVL